MTAGLKGFLHGAYVETTKIASNSFANLSARIHAYILVQYITLDSIALHGLIFGHITCIPTFASTYVHTCIHTYIIHAYIPIDTDGRTDGRTNGRTDRHTDGQTHRHTVGQTNTRMYMHKYVGSAYVCI